MKRLCWLVSFVCFVCFLTSCGGGSSTPPIPALQLTSGQPPVANLMVSYGASGGGFTLSASGGMPPYTWSWTPGTGSTLPPGLDLANGIISGMPTTLGTYTVVITVADAEAQPQQVTATYTIKVTPAPLVIQTSSLPSATIDVLYNRRCRPFVFRCQFPYVLYGLQFVASGGVAPYTWSWAPASGSSLPPGMTFSASGFLAGIPTAVATYNLVFTVTDSQSPAAQTTANLSLNVHYPAPPGIFTSPDPPAGGANLPYSFTFTASGTAPLTWTETGALPSGLTFASGLLSGTPTTTGSFPITLAVQDKYGQNSTPQNFTILIFLHGFVATGTMGTARQHHTATLLQNGKVLVAGGADSNGNATATAELYDPANGTFTPTSGNMTVARSSHTATLLTNGKVLIAGGTGSGPSAPTAELFDPATGTFTATNGAMTAVRTSHTATLLTNGQVLLAGGTDTTSVAQLTAELFDPASGTFTATTGKMGTARAAQSATSLSSGKVLVAGGFDATGAPVATAEIFDPSAGTFTATTGNMTIARAYHTATFLTASGKVLFAGGEDATGAPGATADLFDPSAGTFTATTSPMMTVRNQHNANLLADGTVLVMGGDASGTSPSLAEIFNPSSTSFSQTGSMTVHRSAAASVLLTNGKVLVTGGADVLGTSIATAELYQ